MRKRKLDYTGKKRRKRIKSQIKKMREQMKGKENKDDFMKKKG